MGLFEDVWNWIKSKVQYLIDSAISNVKTWARNTINAAIAGIQKVYNYFYDYITNVYNTTKKYITNVYNYVTENITNVVNNITEYVTNVTNVTKQYITNVIGSSKEWVLDQLANERSWTRNFFLLMDPTGFLKDPLSHIKAAFDIQRQVAETAVIRSFWEGLEEGLAE